jgi:hypothetical protein
MSPIRINPKLAPREALALFFRAGLNSNGRKWERRLYKRLWVRVRRLDPEFRLRDADRMRVQSRLPEVKKADAARHARYVRDHRSRVRRYNARYHRTHRRRYCSFCGRPAPKGRYGLRPVGRVVPRGSRMVEVPFLWCGC